MSLWLRVRGLHTWGLLALAAAVIAGPLSSSYVPMPTLFGVLLPVVSSAIAAVVFSVALLALLDATDLEAAAVRKLAFLNVGLVATLCLAALLVGLALKCNFVGARCIFGLAGLSLTLALLLRVPWSSLIIVGYFVAAATLGHEAGSSEVQVWAWIVDGSNSRSAWMLSFGLFAIGVVLHLAFYRSKYSSDIALNPAI